MLLSLLQILLLTLQCFAFDDSEFLPAIAQRKLANKHLIMVGDSLMRYQYLSLVYAVKFGVKVIDSEKRNFVREHTFANWSDYYVRTNLLLRPNEYCDCYRTPDGLHRKQFENRFYEDKEKNIKITFLLFYGKYNQGHWNNATDSNKLRQPESEYTPAIWRSNLPDTLTGFLKENAGNRNASILLLNAGLHENHFM